MPVFYQNQNQAPPHKVLNLRLLPPQKSPFTMLDTRISGFIPLSSLTPNLLRTLDHASCIVPIKGHSSLIESRLWVPHTYFADATS